jgi:Protein of unknown function (DUF4238)
MSDPNRHHYIPKFYLRRWANAGGKVSSYSWQGAKLYIGEYSPRSIGAEDGLYSLDGVPAEMRNSIERVFMGPMVDGPAADGMRVLLGEAPGPLSIDGRTAWVRFLVSLMCRTPRQFAALKSDGAATLRAELQANPEEYEKIRGPDDPPTFLEFIQDKKLDHLIDNFGTMMLPQFVDIPHMNYDIARMDWRVQHYRDGAYGFITSDFPICMLPGLAYPDCIISLPLSPTAVFLAGYDSSLLDALAAQPPHRVIDRMNEISAQSAQRYVFADTGQYAELVKKMLRKPE